jgi:CubicO group peptidase (beta-lactamase class C family)
MSHILTILAFSIILLVPLSVLLARESSVLDSLGGFTKFAQKLITEWRVPGMAVGVVKDGEVIYMEGFGYRDVEKNLPVTPRTLFAIGSSTKAFTAAVLGMLVDEGKLDLDKPLIEYMPDFRLYDEYSTLHTTPRDLLCHRTGMPGYDALWILSRGNRDEYYQRLRYLEPSSGFRDVFQYNNLMYMVAGILVGRLAGSSWEDFVAERIFKQIGMKNSNFSISDSKAADNFSQPYMTFSGDPIKIPFRNIDATGPAGSINSNIEDMTKWILLHLKKGKVRKRQIISEASLAQTHLPNMVIKDPCYEKMAQFSVYGQGWGISNYRGYSLIEHGGNIDGFSALVSLLPEKNAGVVVLSNSLNIMGYAIVREIYDHLLGLDKRDWNLYYKDMFAEIMAMFSGSKGVKEEPKPGTNPSLPLIDYAGIYSHPAFGRVEVITENEKLAVKFQSGLTSTLEHFHYDVFTGTTSDFYLSEIRVRFHLNNAGALESFSMPLESGVNDIFFNRIY